MPSKRILFCLFFALITGCDAGNLIDQAADDTIETNEDQIRDFFEDSNAEEPDTSAELVECPFPEDLRAYNASFFNLYTPVSSRPINELEVEMAFTFSDQYYIYFYAPIDPTFISALFEGADAIIQVENYGEIKLLNYLNEARPRAIVVNNVVFDPVFFFEALTSEYDTLADIISAASSNTVNSNPQDSDQPPICEISEISAENVRAD